MNNCDALFYLNPQPMWVYAVDTLLILEVNDAAIKRYGYSKDEFTGKSIKELRPAEEIHLMEKIIQKERSAVSSHWELRHKAADGTIFNVEVISYAVIHNGIAARLVQAQDINAKKSMQGRLQVTQDKLDRLLDSTSIGFYQLDNTLTITYWNQAAEQMTGYSSKHITGKNIWDVFPEALYSDFHVYIERAIRQRMNVEFTEYYWPLQKWFFVNVYPGDDGTLVHFRDITSIKRSQEVLLEKIDKLRELSIFNSHYIRKPVASLLGLAGILKENIANPEEFKDIAEHIQECSLELDDAIKKIAKKVNDSDNLQGLVFEMEEFLLNKLVEQIIEEYKRNRGGAHLQLVSAVDIKYYGSKACIKAAIESLIDNAIKFSPGPGKVIVTTRLVNQNIVLSVQDFGVGMDDELVGKIFMGFAKKELSRNLGDGLARVSEALRRHHGNIWVESEHGKGTTFSIRLPLSNVAAFKAGVKTDRTVYRSKGLEIRYNSEGGYVQLDWRGFHNLQSIKAGCLELATALKKYKCRMILNNNTHVLGSWEDAVEWVGTDCFPHLEEAGLHCLAWVYSPSTFSRMSADLVIEMLNSKVVIRTFDDELTAREWLEQMGHAYEIA